MAELKILSFNTQGLGGIKKQKDVFQYLNDKNFDIYCLQDTHFTNSDEMHIRNRWDGKCFFGPAPQSNARGVAIFFNKNVDCKIHKHKHDTDGNFLILDITIWDKRLTLVNIYGPNKDEPKFYENVFNCIAEMENDTYIICGDFNLTLDQDMDCFNYKHINNPKARSFVTNSIKENNLFDTFRELHPSLKRYTWRRKNPFKQSRLDFFLVTENLINLVKTSKIETGYKSDHSIVTLSLTMNTFEHGKGLWKHNNSLLNDIEYLNAINSKILEIKKQYCLPIYNLENIDQIPDDELQFIINDSLFLETLMMEIRGKSISYASYKKKAKNKEEKELITKIQNLEEKLVEETIPKVEVLDKLISTDQTGFIKGRYIGENTRLVYDLLQFTEENNIPGLLLLIDFEKAFDSLSWSFINKVLQFFNFGPSIRNWISTFYKNSSSAVLQCGHLSSFFKLGRGCRQGDPISPYLFILCAEILSVRIRNNKNIKGIKIDNTEIKFSQYADDASAFLDGSKQSLEEILQELETFADISGLKTNFDKTQVVWIGAKKYSTDSIKTRWKLSWGTTQFKLLGVIFNVDLDKIVDINYKDKIAQVKNLIKIWQRRFLTPLGNCN